MRGTKLGPSFAVMLLAACGADDHAQPNENETQLARTVQPSDWLPPSTSSIVWLPCNEADYECANLSVPVAYDNPFLGNVTLALKRHRATGDRLGSLLVNPGGPGGAIVERLAHYVDMLPAFLVERFDIVGFDPRGVGNSAPLYCSLPLNVLTLLLGTPDPNDPRSQIEYRIHNWALLSQGCVLPHLNLTPFMTTPNVARDLDRIREGLGEDELNYLGLSYGTSIGAWYAELFPEHVGRFVLDGAMDPAADLAENIAVQARGEDASLQRFFDWCDTSTNVCPWATGSAATAFDALMAKLLTQPLMVDDEQVGVPHLLGVVRTHLVLGRSAWPELSNILGTTVAGDAVPLRDAANAILEPDDHPPGTLNNSDSAFYAVVCNDRRRDLTVDDVQTALGDLAQASPRFAPYMDSPLYACASWPTPKAADVTPHGKGAGPILVIGTTYDPATPYPLAQGMAKELASASLLTVEGDGHCAVPRRDPCVVAALQAYVIDGVVPQAGATCTESTTVSNPSMLPLVRYPSPGLLVTE